MQATLIAIEQLLRHLRQDSGVLVRVASATGSVPREPGAWMAVFPRATVGTIGGGRLEHDAIARSRAMLAGSLPLGAAPASAAPQGVRFALGPSLGQCCGGVVYLQFQAIGSADAPALRAELAAGHAERLAPAAVFGGGHVGAALVGLLATLPFAVTWVDSRDGVFPQPLPDGVHCEHSDPVQAAVAALVPWSRVAVMSFSHAEDLDIVAACLLRQRSHADLAYIGLIGSRTKWATFRSRLLARGFSEAELAAVTCPIGVQGVRGKEPQVLAVAIAAQMLQLPADRQPDA
jgi:xanthine dehydrogenase accessory factor